MAHRVVEIESRMPALQAGLAIPYTRSRQYAGWIQLSQDVAMYAFYFSLSMARLGLVLGAPALSR